VRATPKSEGEATEGRKDAGVEGWKDGRVEGWLGTQIMIKAAMAVIDLEGCSPISANLFCKISALAIRVSGLVR